MATKNIIIKKKIANEIFELMPKTVGTQVEVTYGSEVKDLASVLSTVFTDLTAWNTFKANVDFAGTDSALDTLRELIDMISSEELATSIANELKGIKERLDAAELAATQLAQTVADNKLAADATEAKAEQNKKDIAALTETVNANKTAAETAIGAVDKKADDNAAAIETVDGKADANATAIEALQGVVAQNARVIVAETVPDDLTEADLMMQII